MYRVAAKYKRYRALLRESKASTPCDSSANPLPHAVPKESSQSSAKPPSSVTVIKRPPPQESPTKPSTINPFSPVKRKRNATSRGYTSSPTRHRFTRDLTPSTDAEKSP